MLKETCLDILSDDSILKGLSLKVVNLLLIWALEVLEAPRYTLILQAARSVVFSIYLELLILEMFQVTLYTKFQIPNPRKRCFFLCPIEIYARIQMNAGVRCSSYNEKKRQSSSLALPMAKKH